MYSIYYVTFNLIQLSLLVCIWIQGYNAQSTVEYFENGKLPTGCNMHIGVDWYGGDMIRNPIENIDNPGDCCALCGRQLGCRGWLWRKDFNHCWLKNRIYRPIKCDNCVGGIFHNVAALICEEHRGAWNGANLEIRIGTTVGDCCNACEVTPECRGWTFKNSTSPRCFLKSDTGEATNCSTCTSGEKDPIRVSCHTVFGVDWYGFDINGTNPYTGSSPEDCCDRCRDFPDCRAWLFRETNAACYLKRAVNPNEQPCPECTGGVIR